MKIKHVAAEIIPGILIDKKLSESGMHIVYAGRQEQDQKEVVVKTLIDSFPKKEQIASIRREYDILTKLQMEGVIGGISLLAHGNGNLAIVMERFGHSLHHFLQTFKNNQIPLQSFFAIAIPLVKLVGQIHNKKIIHKDINPFNVLVDAETLNIKIIDFDSSSELSREYHDFSLAKNIVGSLPYMSPEQTGRMNRDVDYRSDYYSLGITFYEMLTGQLPFVANDPLEWVHCHIGKKAFPANDINRSVPTVLAKMVSKLMSKNAEDRYQSSHGLIADLEKCKAEIENGNLDFQFQLGQEDVSRSFQIPQQLFGREEELKQLELYFDNACQGAVSFCLVAGYSGVGKSVLVQELGRSIVKKHGSLIQGKFEQFKQNMAYAAFASAFRGLIYQILGEPVNRLSLWREKLDIALGESAQLLIDIIPELELVMGQQPAVQELSPAETQKRFQKIIQSFIKVFATADHPLVLFLDDLQWSDIPTLNLIQKLVTTQELDHLFIIGAFRDNAVDETHPLSLTLREIQAKRFVETLHLKPLSEEAVNQITSEALLSAKDKTFGLSQIIYEKTAGNPFFTIALLKDLYEKEHIFFNEHTGKWDWDMSAIAQTNKTENVIDFLVASQSRLPTNTQQVIQLAACIGAKFDLETLAVIHQKSMSATALDLEEALKTSMVIPLSENYKYAALGESQVLDEWAKRQEESALNSVYKFQHDRVQQAAYSMIAPEKREALHYSIGRLMLQHTRQEKLNESLLDIVGHLNEGKALVSDWDEKTELATLNVTAGVMAKQSSAYASALGYLHEAEMLVYPKIWDSNPVLAWRLSEEIQQCSYLTGKWEEAHDWSEAMLLHAETPIQKAMVLAARTRQYATIGKPKESIQAACDGLSHLGFHFLQDPQASDVEAESHLVVKNLKGRNIADLVDMQDLKDPHAQLASQLMMETFAAAFLSGSGHMFPYLVLKSVNLALCYGNSPETAFAYAAYGMLLCGFLNDPATGYAYGKLGVNISEKYSDVSLKSRIYYVYAMFVHHWSNHWSTMTPWFRKGIEAGYQSGDLLYLAYSAQDCIIWDPQLDLESSAQEHEKLLNIVKECEYQDSYDSGTLFLQMQKNFLGLTQEKFSLTNENFNEEERVMGMRNRHFMTGIANYNLYKAEVYCFYNEPFEALPFVLEMENRVSSIMSLPQIVRFFIVSFLVYADVYSSSTPAEQAEMVEKMNRAEDKMRQWALHFPDNFLHLQLLMEAEKAAINGKTDLAIVKFEESIAAAQQYKFLRDEAMANERAARFYLQNGSKKAAEGYLLASRYLYYLWGAKRKVMDMQETYGLSPFQLNREGSGSFAGSQQEQAHPLHTLTKQIGSENLDMASVFKASQAISGELVLEKLLKATLQILIENAGAQKGCLIEEREGKLLVLDFYEINSNHPNDQPIQQQQQIFPLSLVNTVMRTKEAVFIDNATKVNTFSADPYIIKEKPLSIMCVPIPQNEHLKAVVYLENNLSHSTFSEDRIKIINLLAGQASISIANARIYEEQKILLQAQQRFVPIQFLKNLGHNDISKVKLGESVTMDMTVLFSDLMGFTSMSERHSPDHIIRLLNDYYSALGIPIVAAGGFIDSYAGDEIMALFPVSAQAAVGAAIQMFESLRHFNVQLNNRGEEALHMGLGMNTGQLVLGTMGGLDRMQCSVLGDTVNLASRIEQLTRTYDAPLLIGENTFSSLVHPDKFSMRMVDYVAVKGKGSAVKLYEVLDALPEKRRKAKEASKANLAEGFALYFNREFKTASEIFYALSQQDKEDPVLALFHQRSQQHLAIPPPPDWKGFEKLNKK